MLGYILSILQHILFFALRIEKNSFPRPLTKEEQDQCFRKIKNKDKTAIDMLINQISETIYFKVPPVAYNDIIDLRRTKDYIIENMYCDDTVGQYYIYLHNTKTCVGSVDYRGYHVHEYFGDAGGFVDYEYRGNGYLYQALTLLRKMLNENRVEDFWVSASQDNIPSIKTIEKLGEILLKKSNEIFLYKVKTKNNL